MYTGNPAMHTPSANVYRRVTVLAFALQTRRARESPGADLLDTTSQHEARITVICECSDSCKIRRLRWCDVCSRERCCIMRAPQC